MMSYVLDIQGIKNYVPERGKKQLYKLTVLGVKYFKDF